MGTAFKGSPKVQDRMTEQKSGMSTEVPWRKSLRFRLTILIALAALITGSVMILLLSMYMGNTENINFFGILIAEIILVSVLVISVLLNLFILKKLVIIPIKKISEGVISWSPDAKRKMDRPKQNVMRKGTGDELDLLERHIIEMENRVYDSVEAERLASSVKNAFLANMSHELRTPLNSTINMINEAISADEPERRKEALNQALSSSSDLMAVINTILEISNIESGSLILSSEPFLLSKTAAEISSFISVLCRAKGLKWEQEIHISGIQSLKGDRIRLMQVLTIMLRNAVKFAREENGKVSFWMDVLEETETDVCIRFKIIDNGIGMNDGKLNELREIFSDDSNGMNYSSGEIMLSACSGIIKAMGSNIMVESRKDMGSRFMFDLRFPKLSMPYGNEEPEPASIDFSGMYVLIVDDIKVNRTVLRHIISKTGMKIIEAKNGIEAVEIFMLKAKNIDIILMDIMMPEMDGYEATMKIRNSGLEKGNTVPIIAVSTRSYREDIEAAIESGMNYHLEKPVESGLLLHCMAKFLKK